LLVFNKMDAMAPESLPIRLSDSYEMEGVQTPRVFVSAKTLSGMPRLREMLAERAKTPADPAALPLIYPD
jgi:GTP-binding protein HflX